jgi:GDPmannose 4,6-dehydratase
MISVREFCEKAFGRYSMDYRDFVEIDERYYRPAEVDQLLGNPEKAKKQLGWNPKVTIDELIAMMADHDFQLARKEQIINIHDTSIRKIQ